MITLAASDPGIGALAFRLVASLAVVVGLLLLIARFVNKRFSAPAGAPVQVMHRQQLGRGQGVAVISVGGRVLVVGTTEHQVTLLTELDPSEVAVDVPALAADDTSVDTDLDTGLEVDPIVAGALGLEVVAPAEPTEPTEPTEPDTAAAFGRELAAASYDAKPGALAGSILSPQTWRQTFAAFSGQAAPPSPGRRAS